MSHVTLVLLRIIVNCFWFSQSAGLLVSPKQHRLSLHSGFRNNATQNDLVVANTTAADAQLLKEADAYLSNTSMTSSAAYKAWAAKIQEMTASAVQDKLKALATPSAEEQQCDIQRQYTAAPDLCSQQNNRIPRERLMQYMTHFKNDLWAAFKKQFGEGETCCMGINHQFAVYTTVKELQPLVIIESGVAAGRGTWLLRHAAGASVPIFSLDPGVPKHGYPGRSWEDASGATKYLTGANFQDLALVRWDILIPDPAWRARTLIILDDHQSSIERLKMLRRWGFRYVFYEDNYPFTVATSLDKTTCEKLVSTPRVFTKPLYGDAYSPNTVCASVPPSWNFVLEKDRFGHKCKFLTLPEHAANAKWFQDHLHDYFEFPAVFSRCTGLTREPLLGQDPATLSLWGFPQPEMELWQYGHLFPALMELKPLQPAEVMTEYHAALAAVAAVYTEIVTHKWPYR